MRKWTAPAVVVAYLALASPVHAAPPSVELSGSFSSPGLPLAAGSPVKEAGVVRVEAYLYANSQGRITIRCISPSGQPIDTTLPTLGTFPSSVPAGLMHVSGKVYQVCVETSTGFVYQFFDCSRLVLDGSPWTMPHETSPKAVPGAPAFALLSSADVTATSAEIVARLINVDPRLPPGNPVAMTPAQPLSVMQFGADSQFGPQAVFDSHTRTWFAYEALDSTSGAATIHAGTFSSLQPLPPTVDISQRIHNTQGRLPIFFAPAVRGSTSGSAVIFTLYFNSGLGRPVYGAEIEAADGTPVLDIDDFFPGLPESLSFDTIYPLSVVPSGRDTWVAAGEGLDRSQQAHVVINTISPSGVGVPVDLTLPSQGLMQPQLLGPNDLLVQVLAGPHVRASSMSTAAAVAPGVYRQKLLIPQTCTPGDTTLCLNGGRFRVDVTDVTSQGAIASGHGQALTDDTGYFWFFAPTNVEMLVKVINGCGVNGHYWVFAGGLTNVLTNATVIDTTTGALLTFSNPQGTPFQPYQNTQAFACGAAAADDVRASSLPEPAATRAEREPTVAVGQVASACVADATHLCLVSNRFQVSTVWTSGGHSGAGQAVAITPDTGYFWFFSASNVEMVAKVVDGCSLGGHYWVFAGGLTNVKVVTTVKDTQSGAVKTYTNPASTPFLPLQDTNAFTTCP